jgi:hypothetical protein
MAKASGRSGKADGIDQNKTKNKPKREIPDKCVRCSLMSMPQVHEKHGGPEGCWDPNVCYARRSHAKNRDRRNLARSLKGRVGATAEIQVEGPQLLYGVLVIYRPAGAMTPVHAIGAEVWNHEGRVRSVGVRHCLGLTPGKLMAYVQRMLRHLRRVCGFRQFAVEIRREVFECPIRPCPHYSAGRGDA